MRWLTHWRWAMAVGPFAEPNGFIESDEGTSINGKPLVARQASGLMRLLGDTMGALKWALSLSLSLCLSLRGNPHCLQE